MSKRLIKIEITKEQYQEGKKMAEDRGIPFIDCLNAIQARDHNAILVTQDNHFFENLSDVTTPFKPQNVN